MRTLTEKAACQISDDLGRIEDQINIAIAATSEDERRNWTEARLAVGLTRGLVRTMMNELDFSSVA